MICVAASVKKEKMTKSSNGDAMTISNLSRLWGHHFWRLSTRLWPLAAGRLVLQSHGDDLTDNLYAGAVVDASRRSLHGRSDSPRRAASP